MANQVPNKFKDAILKGLVNTSSDTLKMILMKSGFVFNKATHGVYLDVDQDELTTVNTSYVAGGSAVASATVAQDDTLNCGKLTVSHAGWTAATGDTIGPASGAILYDDTCATSGYVDVIVCYIDFLGAKTVTEGGLFKITDPVIKIT
jgi:hypothetical protein